MGHPHTTVDLPDDLPAIAGEVRSVRIPDGVSSDLLTLVTGAGAPVEAHVCATAWVLSTGHDRILLVEHRALGWSTPGGHLYPGETSLAAALRELEEETGVTSESVEILGDGPAIIHATDIEGSRPHRHWNIGWLLRADEAVSARGDFSGEERAMWWPCSALPSGARDLPESVERILRHLGAPRRDD